MKYFQIVALFGLIGTNILHSQSPEIWKNIFTARGLNHSYSLFRMTSLKSLPEFIRDNPDLMGFNLTIPFKSEVIKLLIETDSVVSETQACNTVKIQRDGEKYILIGFNTDMEGFLMSISHLPELNNEKALIFGAGGAARSVKLALAMRGIESNLVSRKFDTNLLNYNNITEKQITETRILINATPLGGPGFDNEKPPLPYHCINSNHYLFDLLYHSLQTPFLKQGINAGAFTMNGMQMLINQANLAADILLEE